MCSNATHLSLSRASGSILRPGLPPARARGKGPRIISFTFISPHRPIQDRKTCTYVRLLGPCFKTGRVDDRPTHPRDKSNKSGSNALRWAGTTLHLHREPSTNTGWPPHLASHTRPSRIYTTPLGGEFCAQSMRRHLRVLGL
jgi:hypothetical protein